MTNRSQSIVAASALALLVSLVASPLAPSRADDRNDDFADGSRDTSLWNETESWVNQGNKKKKCKIEEKSGEIQVNATGGKGGSAAYTSAWQVDWTDSFSIEFDHELIASKPKKASKGAISGLSIGFGTFTLSEGFTTGVSVQVVQAKSGRTVQLVARRGSQTRLDSATISSGDHSFTVSWVATSDGTVSVFVYRDGSANPVVSLDGIESTFAGKTGVGATAAFFGRSKGNWKFRSDFDDVAISSDDWDDSDDSGFDDDDFDGFDDDDWDDDDDDGEDDGEGDDDGDDDGDDSDGDDSDDDGHSGNQTLPAGTFVSTLESAESADDIASPAIEAEVEDGAGGRLDTIHWDAAAGELIFARTNATTSVTTVTGRRTPTAQDLNRYGDGIDALDSVVMSAAEAIDAAVGQYPGARVEEVELDLSGGTPIWEIDLQLVNGSERRVAVPAG